MKLCVQAIYIYFPFLIPQRYIWVKKKALSGNVIKLSKSAHTKKKPTSTFRGGHFLCFRYVDRLCLLRGQDNDLSLVNGVGVHKTVGVALEDGLVLHQTGICNYIPYILAFFTITLSPFSNCSLETPLNPSPTCSVLYPQPFDFRSFVCISMVVIIVSNTPPFVL